MTKEDSDALVEWLRKLEGRVTTLESKIRDLEMEDKKVKTTIISALTEEAEKWNLMKVPIEDEEVVQKPFNFRSAKEGPKIWGYTHRSE